MVAALVKLTEQQAGRKKLAQRLLAASKFRRKKRCSKIQTTNQSEFKCAHNKTR